MTVRILEGDVRDRLRELPDESVHCVVTSPPYWGLRDYGVEGQLGLERTLGEHLGAMVGVFAEVRRVMRKDATLWLNYGDSYACKPNGKSAAIYKAEGNDDRTHRDKPFSTIGAIYAPDPRNEDRRGQHSTLEGSAPVHTPGRIMAIGGVYDPKYATPRGQFIAGDKMTEIDHGGMSGGHLKPGDMCMVPERLAIALQEDGWWVRSRIVWGKTNTKPDSSGRWRPSYNHEMIWMLAKSQRCYYDAAAVRQPTADSTKRRIVQNVDAQAGSLCPGKANGPLKAVGKKNDRLLRAYEPAPAEVWEMSTAAYAEAHFATFPPELARRCILAGCPEGGTVLDPFGGSGTTGLVADSLKRNAVLIDLNPGYVAMAKKRVHGELLQYAAD